jgi:hypothetical protein
MATDPQAASPVAVPAPPFGALGRLVASARERRALRTARRAADADLLLRETPSLRLAWRAAELVVPKRRRQLARTLRELVREADPRVARTARVFDAAAVRELAPVLLQAANRLEDLERPVAPRGILLLESLLTDPWGPLYDRGRAEQLGSAVVTAADALELS